MVKEAPTPEQIKDLLEKTTKKSKLLGKTPRKPKELIKDIDEREKKDKLAEKDKQKKLSKEDKAIEKAKKKLEEAKKKNDPKAIKKAEAELKKAKEAKRKKEQMGLDKLTKKMFKNEKDLEKAGAKKKEAPKKEKDDKDKKKEKEQTKDKDSKEVTKKKEEMQKKYANIKLPGGLTIKQQGPAWVLVDAKSGKTKDVTTEMEGLIKANKDIDKANKQIDKNNQHISAGQIENAVKGDDLQPRNKLKTNEMIDNSVAGISTGQMKVEDPAKGMADIPTAVPEVKITDFDGKNMDPTIAKGLAIVAVANAFDKNDLERLQEKDRQQKQEREQQAKQTQMPQKGGRE